MGFVVIFEVCYSLFDCQRLGLSHGVDHDSRRVSL